jgi:hypothetical protein
LIKHTNHTQKTDAHRVGTRSQLTCELQNFDTPLWGGWQIKTGWRRRTAEHTRNGNAPRVGQKIAKKFGKKTGERAAGEKPDVKKADTRSALL